ncbi:MAG: L-threonylcarbamoyladenylate synthase [Firmicutes bacterium]|nr:L-threonylcarbamoyladenylate synthase [Bacillota bacterium]
MSTENSIIKEVDNNSLLDAVKLLASGEVVAFPTETVYGLGANAYDALAVAKLYDVKGRGFDKPITLMLHSVADIEKYVVVDEVNKEFAYDELNKGNTIVFKLKDNNLKHLSNATSAKITTLGIRIPQNKEALDLLKLSAGGLGAQEAKGAGATSGVANSTAAGFPLAVTSANLSGSASKSIAADVYKEIGDKVPLILKSDICRGIASRVIDISSGEILIRR